MGDVAPIPWLAVYEAKTGQPEIRTRQGILCTGRRRPVARPAADLIDGRRVMGGASIRRTGGADVTSAQL